MIEGIILLSTSLATSYFFVWINIQRLALIPLAIGLAYIVMSLSGFSMPYFTTDMLKIHGAKFSRSLICIGLMLLFISKGLVWFFVVGLTSLINLLLYLSSYQRDYREWKSTFLIWFLTTFILGIGYILQTGQYHVLGVFVSIYVIGFFTLTHLMTHLRTQLSESDRTRLQLYKEISAYGIGLTLIYRLFQPSLNAIIVWQLAFITCCIAIRQSYLSRSKEVLQEKKVWLSGRAILAGQKVLDWYDDQSKAFDLHMFNFLIQKGYLPSSFGMKLLQYIQIILIVILIIATVIGLFGQVSYNLVRYWLGILCFVITLFGVKNEEQLLSYYKIAGISIITGSYYITLFDVTSHSSVFTRGSLTRLSLNMMLCLFYEQLFPQAKQLFTRSDILFWLMMIMLGSIITILSLVWLPINSSVLFAIGFIIIGMVGFFAYHIREKVQPRD